MPDSINPSIDQDFRLLVAFILDRAAEASLSTRIHVYRGLSQILPDPAATAQLLQIASELEKVEQQYRSFEFMLQNPPPPTALPTEPSGNGEPTNN